MGFDETHTDLIFVSSFELDGERRPRELHRYFGLFACQGSCLSSLFRLPSSSSPNSFHRWRCSPSHSRATISTGTGCPSRDASSVPRRSFREDTVEVKNRRGQRELVVSRVDSPHLSTRIYVARWTERSDSRESIDSIHSRNTNPQRRSFKPLPTKFRGVYVVSYQLATMNTMSWNVTVDGTLTKQRRITNKGEI